MLPTAFSRLHYSVHIIHILYAAKGRVIRLSRDELQRIGGLAADYFASHLFVPVADQGVPVLVRYCFVRSIGALLFW